MDIIDELNGLQDRAACLLMENAVLLARLDLLKLNWRARRIAAGAL